MTSTQLNHIRYGPNDVELNAAGCTVSQVEEALWETLNLGPGMLCYVDRNLILDKENFVLGMGVTVLFWRSFGFKGSGFDDESLERRRAIALERIASALERLNIQFGDPVETSALIRIANHFDPPKRTVVTSSYVAERLGRSIRWIGQLARDGKIPDSCICPDSGNGNYWRFWQDKIDQWIQTQTRK